MRRTTLSVLSALAILLSGMIVPEAAAQSRRDKEQTYVLEKPYEVKKLVPPTGKKIKNVILMIGDGMSLMHMYSAWTANRGKLWLDNSQYTGLSKTYCANRLITDSGAGGTALATGHKTNYHMVGVDPEGKPWNLWLPWRIRKACQAASPLPVAYGTLRPPTSAATIRIVTPRPRS